MKQLGLVLSLVLSWGSPLFAQQMEPVETTVDEPGQGLKWIGPDGGILPFRSYAEIEDFLATADVLEMKVIPHGVTRPHKVTLSRDGTQMHAVFREVNEFRHVWRGSRTTTVNFRDSYLFEVASYRLSRLLGMDNVPPTVRRKLSRVGQRKIRPRDGSLQAWVENAFTDRDRRRRKLAPPNPEYWNKQWNLMVLYDNLIYNVDRNQGNILIGPGWKIWLIDATRAFRPFHSLPNEKQLVWCERTFWRRLQEVTDDQLRELLDPYLSSLELGGLLARRQMLIAHFHKMIETRGESLVLYDLP